jgi:plasmid stabilization system protein ParE
MAFDVQFTAAARRDLIETADHLQADAPEYAPRWLNGILTAARSLQEMPLRHALIMEAGRLGRPLRALVYQSHRIVYEVNETNHVVSIIRVYHSSRAPLRLEDLEG